MIGVEIALTISSFLLAVCLILVGMASVQRLPTSLMFGERIGVPTWLWQLLGWCDLVAAASLIVGVFVSNTVVLLGAALAAGSLAIVLGFQWLSRDSLAMQVPVLVLLGMVALTITLERLTTLGA